jgi:ABC-type antimicrobial peptide transport system permease subunit
MAAVGLYGVVAHALANRTVENGIRMALGAGRSDIDRLVTREGLALTAIGLALGLVAAVLVSRTLSVFLFGVGPSDPALAVDLGRVRRYARFDGRLDSCIRRDPCRSANGRSYPVGVFIARLA